MARNMRCCGALPRRVFDHPGTAGEDGRMKNRTCMPPSPSRMLADHSRESAAPGDAMYTLRARIVSVTVALLLVALFVSPSAAWAAPFGGRAHGFTFGCTSGALPYDVSRLGVEGRSAGFCADFVPNGTSSARSQADTFSSPSGQIRGAVTSDSLGASATALAESFDTVTIHPPPGSPAGAAADILAGDAYTISISNA